MKNKFTILLTLCLTISSPGLLAQRGFSQETLDLFDSLRDHAEYFQEHEFLKSASIKKAHSNKVRLDLNVGNAKWLLATSTLVHALRYRLDGKGVLLSRDDARVAFLKSLYARRAGSDVQLTAPVEINKDNMDEKLARFVVLVSKMEGDRVFKSKIQERLNKDREAFWLKVEKGHLDLRLQYFGNQVLEYMTMKILDDGGRLKVGAEYEKDRYVTQRQLDRYSILSQRILEGLEQYPLLLISTQQRAFELLLLHDIATGMADLVDKKGLQFENYPKAINPKFGVPIETLKSPYEARAHVSFMDLENAKLLESALCDLLEVYNIEMIRDKK